MAKAWAARWSNRTAPSPAASTVSVSRRGQIYVDKLQYFANSGYTINPLAAREQAESSAIWEMSHAFFGGLDIRDGRVVNTSFDSLPAAAQCPMRRSTSRFISRTPKSVVGRPRRIGWPAEPPAIANAIF